MSVEQNLPAFIQTPAPPYYAVIFAARLKNADLAPYSEGLDLLTDKVRRLQGFLGEDALRIEDGRLISVSYWRDHESILSWSRDPDHIRLKQRGRKEFYETFELRIAKVERAMSFTADEI